MDDELQSVTMTLTLTSASGKILYKSVNVAPDMTPFMAARLQVSMLDAWIHAKLDARDRG